MNEKAQIVESIPTGDYTKAGLSSDLPTWVRWLVRIYGGVLLLVFLSALFLSALVLSDYSLSSLVSGEYVDIPDRVHSFFLLLLVFFQSAIGLVYVAGLLRLKRWVVWPSSLWLVCLLSYLVVSLSIPAGLQNVVSLVIYLTFTLITLVVVVLLWRFSVDLTPSSWSGYLVAGLFTLFFLPHLFFGMAFFVIKDIPSVDDYDLILEPVPVLDRDRNIHYALPDLGSLGPQEKVVLGEALRVSSDHTRGGEVQLSEAAVAVETTRKYTDQFIEATKREAYQCPISVNQYSSATELCSLNDLRGLSSLMALRSYVSLQTGDIEDVALSSSALLRFAYLMGDSEGDSLIEWLVSVAIYNYAFDSFSVAADHIESDGHSSTTTEAIGKIKTALVRYSAADMKVSLKNALRAEYMIRINSLRDSKILEDEYGFSFDESYYWHPNRTIREDVSLTRKQIEYASVPCGEGDDIAEDLDNIVTESRATVFSPASYVKPNLFGRMLFSVTAASLTSVKDKGCALEESHQEVLDKFEHLSDK